MLKRFIFILVLLTIAFFIYRKINPEGAQNLINKVNHILGRDEVASLTGDALTGDLLSGELLTGTLFTGDVSTGAEITGTVALTTGGLLDNVDIAETTTTGTITETTQLPTGATVVTPTAQAPTTEIAPKTTTTTTTKTTTKPKTSSDVKSTQTLINSLFK